MSSRRVLVIWNANAGGGDPSEAAAGRERVRHALAEHGVDAELFDSASEKAAAARIAVALSEGYDAIVAAGGDGTVRSVAFHLLDTKTPLGILPLGTAMNVARSLGLPLDLDAAADVLATGDAQPIDVGYVRDEPFLEVATIGLAAELLAHATEVGNGRLRSAFHFIERTVRHRRTRMRLDLDERTVRHRAVSVAVANGPFTGRALAAAPDASVDDGAFDVVCFLGYGPREFLRELARLTLGIGSGATTATYRARRVRIRTHHPLPVRADSRDVGTTPVELTVRPGALRVLTPSTGAPGRRPLIARSTSPGTRPYHPCRWTSTSRADARSRR